MQELESRIHNILEAVISSSENLIFDAADPNLNNIFNESSFLLKELATALINYEENPNQYAECIARKVISAAHLLGILQKRGFEICNNCPDIQAGESKTI